MTTAISTNTQPTRGLALQSFDDALKFAQMVSKSEFAPKDFRGKPESCLLAIQAGSEVGLTPMQSLQSIAVINGRPTIWGDAALALVQSSPVCEWVKEYLEGDGDALVAVCEAKRRGYPDPTVVRFSVADAKRAGLWGKSGPWQQYSTRMLALRARGFALRNAFADALRGLITAEEAQDYPQASEPVTARVTQPAPEPEPVAQPASGTAFENAMLAIQRATNGELLDALRSRVEQRLKDKTFASFEADHLFDLIHAKAEELEADRDSVPFDSAEVEAEAASH
jgi:hypothetical protein